MLLLMHQNTERDGVEEQQFGVHVEKAESKEICGTTAFLSSSTLAHQMGFLLL